jgi:hypothetical protein
VIRRQQDDHRRGGHGDAIFDGYSTPMIRIFTIACGLTLWGAVAAQAQALPDGPAPNATAPSAAPAPDAAPAPAPQAAAPQAAPAPGGEPPASAADEPHWLPSTATAVLQGLDKITGHVRTIQATIGQPVRFGTLDILVRTCRKRPPEEQPESAAYLQITETKPGEPAKPLFSGWMFASSPAVSALEDPVYDVWVIDCKGA